MSDQSMYLATGLAVLCMLITFWLWISAERELHRFIKDFHGVPRASRYKYKTSRLRRLAQSLFGLPRNYQP
ncbi:hypothetical protein SAMN05444008_11542 [Cnuella takakiae]|uniref:Uncharacterized protein n=1 Tax=Cnuella takakiae TaxID=1302690 RepID=A0A1M5FZZ6_9BACT|nr:hypothetical protein SAMN05444008_11542 [Cnuella takakiae]